MKKVCAWCGGNLDGGRENRGDDRMSRDLCAACAAGVRSEGGVKLRNYLNLLDAPVVAVDSDGVVRVANDQAYSLFGKDASLVVGRKGGDVFECIHAREPEGCGGTVHCSACAIRKTVAETFTSGKPSIRVPAYLKQGRPGRQREIALYLSTEKVGDAVFLRIDRVGKKR